MEHYDDSGDEEEGAGVPGLFSNSKHPGGAQSPGMAVVAITMLSSSMLL